MIMWKKYESRGITKYKLASNNKFKCVSGKDAALDYFNAVGEVDYDTYFSEDNKINYVVTDTKQYMEGMLEVLPTGIYTYFSEDYNEKGFMETTLSPHDGYMDVPINNDVINEVLNFFDKKDVYDSLKMRHKRAIMLMGVPGTGKTTLIHNILTNILKKQEALILFFNGSLHDEIIEVLKKDTRPKILIIEEFTNLVDHEEVSGRILDFLDGESSLKSCFTLASTNYPKKLPINILNRPGRFDKFIEIAPLSEENASKFLTSLGINTNGVSLTNKTFAELREIALLCKLHDLDLTQALAALDKAKAINIINKLGEDEINDFVL